MRQDSIIGNKRSVFCPLESDLSRLTAFDGKHRSNCNLFHNRFLSQEFPTRIARVFCAVGQRICKMKEI